MPVINYPVSYLCSNVAYPLTEIAESIRQWNTKWTPNYNGVNSYVQIPELNSITKITMDLYVDDPSKDVGLLSNGIYDTLAIKNGRLVSQYYTKGIASFTRSSDATAIDTTGNMTVYGLDVPRFGEHGLLFEGRSYNLAIVSTPATEGNSAWWRVSSATISKSTSCVKGIDLSTIKSIKGGTSYAHPPCNIGLTAGRQYAMSFYFRCINDAVQIRLGIDNAFTGSYLAQYISADGAFTTANGIDSIQVTRVENNLFKVQILVTALCTTTSTKGILFYPPSYGNSGEIEVGAVMIEDRGFSSSFIPAQNSSAVRNGDLLYFNFPLEPNTPACVSMRIKRTGWNNSNSRWLATSNFSYWLLRNDKINQTNWYYSGTSIFAAETDGLVVMNYSKEKSQLFINGSLCGELVSVVHRKDKTGDEWVINGDSDIESGAFFPANLYGYVKDVRIWRCSFSEEQAKLIGTKDESSLPIPDFYMPLENNLEYFLGGNVSVVGDAGEIKKGFNSIIIEFTKGTGSVTQIGKGISGASFKGQISNLKMYSTQGHRSYKSIIYANVDPDSPKVNLPVSTMLVDDWCGKNGTMENFGSSQSYVPVLGDGEAFCGNYTSGKNWVRGVAKNFDYLTGNKGGSFVADDIPTGSRLISGDFMATVDRKESDPTIELVRELTPNSLQQAFQYPNTFKVIKPTDPDYDEYNAD